MADSFTVVTPTPTEEEQSAPVAVPVPLPVAPTKDRLGAGTKAAYALGGTTDIFGHWLYNTMVDPVYNVFLGLAPTQVSIVRAVMLLADACSGLLFGWLSDNTRSRWGRRRPYILLGSIASGVALPCLFMARPSWSNSEIFWFMLLSAVLFSPLIASYNTPYQSLGMELTPDYNERTTVMSYKGIVQKAAGALIGGGLWFATLPIFNDPVTGKPDVARGAMWAGAIAGGVMIISGFTNFFVVKERYYAKARSQEKSGFFAMFRDAFSCRPYLVLLGTALVYAVPTGLSNTLAFYSLTYHVYAGDMKASAEVSFACSIAYMIFGIAGVFMARAISRRIGKHKTLIITLLIGLVAFGSSWWLYTPDHPRLAIVCQALNGFSATGLWVVLPSMSADVIDYDELQCGKRREGAYTSTFSWVVKVGMMLSMLIGGPLLELTGFNSKLPMQSADSVFWIRVLFAGIPVTALVIAFILIQLYPLSTERMAAIRQQLETRRGTV
jgi:GPH family glycoside/pentoside/hexuronide:cation symporter